MSTDYRIPSDWYTTVFEREIKGRLYFLIVVLGIAFLVAIGQSKLFFSSIWVIVEFGFNYWAKYIHHMFSNFYWWAIISGIFAAIGSFIGSKTTDLKKILIGTSISFGIGFTITYLLVIIVTIFLYIPLGIFSFVFPDQIHFLSIGFAFLCSTYIVFTIIAVDTPLFLLEVIKKAPLYYKILAVLFGFLLVSKSLSMLLSILQILIEYSIWRVHQAAFIIAFGVSLLFSVFINLKHFKYETKYVKIAVVIFVYILSIMVGNLSEKIFHWGEYWAAFVTAILSPIAFSFILHKITKSIISVISIIAGGICGFGAGLIFANQIGLGIIGQDWFGVICGAAIALGISISLGFMIAPRIAELVTNVFRFRLKIGLLVGTGFFGGIIAGIMIVGFMNR